MKALLPALFSFVLVATLPAQTCREVVRDSSGRIVQTIDRQKQAGGSVQATTRDASGRIIGTATTNPNAGGSSQTTYRDASGRMAGTASTQPTREPRPAPPTATPADAWPGALTPGLAAAPPRIPNTAMPRAGSRAAPPPTAVLRDRSAARSVMPPGG